ncbi:MAG: methylated-DNA--[protein]-cysteine S-methyltransferase [Gammaproteobacteria bacterium]|jgi:methylated-DNA-[protein]-cysteine S-methyltransferase|nr:methylated-DNA--[protein]-cysteine S-methyltransferase [Gammaproteobacteria bacterium]
MLLHYTYLSTPIGHLLLAGQAEQLAYVGLPAADKTMQPPPEWQRQSTILKAAQQQLTEYFAGRRQSFDLLLSPMGTEFQCQVWQQLQQIPYGSVCSYGDIAEAIGRPKACRAVGAANGQNPIPIIIPCHRVIGANGQLTGFSGGLSVKAHLLTLEGVKVDNQSQQALF